VLFYLGVIKYPRKLKRLKNGISCEYYTSSTPLHLAALNGRHKISQLLLDTGFNIGYKDYLGVSALHIASMRKSLQTVHLLIRNSARLDSTSNEGCSVISRR